MLASLTPELTKKHISSYLPAQRRCAPCQIWYLLAPEPSSNVFLAEQHKYASSATLSLSFLMSEGEGEGAGESEEKGEGDGGRCEINREEERMERSKKKHGGGGTIVDSDELEAAVQIT